MSLPIASVCRFAVADPAESMFVTEAASEAAETAPRPFTPPAATVNWTAFPTPGSPATRPGDAVIRILIEAPLVIVSAAAPTWTSLNV